MAVLSQVFLRQFQIIVIIVSLPNCVFSAFQPSFDVTEGEKQYQILVQRTQHPIYGECWRDAIQKLHTDCESLTATAQSRMAFKFFNCFLETTGLATYSCTDDIVLRDCFSEMTDRDFASYTTFFAHTQNMCFFLKSEHWRDETESTISRLIDASAHIGSQLNDQFQMQQMMLQSQKESLKNEQRMLEHGKEVNKALAISKSAAVDLFHHLVNFRATVFGELAGLYTLLFYFFSLAISYLITTARRTKSSRFWLFIIFTITFILEKVFISRNAAHMSSKTESSNQDAFDERIWLLRKLSISLAAVVIIICSAIYRDLNKINNQLLLETRLLLKDLYEQTTILKKQGMELNLSFNSADERNGDQNGIKRTKSVHSRRYELTVSTDDDKLTNRSGVNTNDASYMSQESDYSLERTSVRRKYNLRDRRKISSPESKALSESPTAFEDLVHYMAIDSKRRSLQLRKTFMNQ